MKRPIHTEIATEGQDSFLDVVTNIVGILIILVMVVGARVRHVVLSSKPEGTPATAALAAEVTSLGQTALASERDIEAIEREAAGVIEAAMMAQADRMELATSVAAAKVSFEKTKKASDASTVEAAERASKRSAAAEEIERLDREAAALARAPATAKQVLAYPTPIGRTVNGDEIHFQIDAGRIAYLPLDELFEMARTRTQRHAGSLAQISDRIESVGPAKGFMLDYVMEARVDQARGQVLVRSREWVIRPASAGLGETLDESLRPESQFRATLSRIRPDTTVTLWCYPDSFEAFRTIREELFRLGIPAACRPLPDGAPIGGSAEGSKSVAQ
jgi:hypothetical protein